MNALRALALLALSSPFGACHLFDDPDRPIPERVIRIEIEGCKDATPRPALLAVGGSGGSATLAPVGSAPPPTGGLAFSDPAPVAPQASTPLTEAGRQALVNNLKDQLTREMKRKALSVRDLPEVAAAQASASLAIGQGNYDEAARQLTAAESELRRVSIDRAFVSQRLDRVKSRIEEKKGHLEGNDSLLLRGWQEAETLFLQQRFQQSNQKLDDLEGRIDALLAGPASRNR